MSYSEKLPDIKGKYRQDVNIGKICWFKTNAIVDILFIPKDKQDLQNFLLKKPRDLPVYFMGAGSNLLIRTQKLQGVMIKLGSGFNFTTLEQDYITAGAACLDTKLANFAAASNISGLEFYAGIPGTVGGAIAMNAGTDETETKDVLVDALAININSGNIKKFTNKDFGFTYRENDVTSEWLFLEGRFLGSNKDSSSVYNKMREIKIRKTRVQPVHARTGGSTFKNPPSHKAWKLIDQCGLRGYACGGAKFSELHCNFLINYDNASAKDIESLITIAKDKVGCRFNIKLQEEIKFIG